MKAQNIKIGTCSWKYPSWEGLVYSQAKGINYLNEYAQYYNTVEIDQWFWSLFGGQGVVLPRTEVVDEYKAAVPQDFQFTIKVPNSLTLTHFYKKNKTDNLKPNPYFLSKALFFDFLETIKPIKNKIGVLMFQFEYLNKQKMPGLSQFLGKLEDFFSALPKDYHYALEPRNPNYLNKTYFDFLNKHNLYHVFLEGYYMPHIVDIYQPFKNFINDIVVIRLHGGDREEIEKETKEMWNQITQPHDIELSNIIQMVKELSNKRINIFININNHYEGSAPLTIKKIEKLLSDPDTHRISIDTASPSL